MYTVVACRSTSMYTVVAFNTVLPRNSPPKADQGHAGHNPSCAMAAVCICMAYMQQMYRTKLASANSQQCAIRPPSDLSFHANICIAMPIYVSPRCGQFHDTGCSTAAQAVDVWHKRAHPYYKQCIHASNETMLYVTHDILITCSHTHRNALAQDHAHATTLCSHCNALSPS
jgi:hypothetical protein